MEVIEYASFQYNYLCERFCFSHFECVCIGPDFNTNAFRHWLFSSGKKVTVPQVRGFPYSYDSRQPVAKILWCYENRPFPSSLVSLFQSESKYETFHMKMSSARSFIFMQIEVIFIRMVSHLDSLWNRGTRELGNGLFKRYQPYLTCFIGTEIGKKKYLHSMIGA